MCSVHCSEAVVVTEKVKQVLGKGKTKFNEWRKERENKSILNSCRTEKLEHLENTKMRRSSEGTWLEQENAGCVGGDECVAYSLLQFSCGGEKKGAFSWNSNSWVKWLSPAMHPEPLQLQNLLHLHQCSCCPGTRPREWHIPEDSVTHTSPCSSCCTAQNKSNHFFDPLYLNASNLVYQREVFSWVLQNDAKQGNCIPTELNIHLFLVCSFF